MSRPLRDDELKGIVIELLGWLQDKDISVRDAIAACGFTLTSLVLLAPHPEQLGEEVIETFRASLKEHIERLMVRPHPRRQRRIH